MQSNRRNLDSRGGLRSVCRNFLAILAVGAIASLAWGVAASQEEQPAVGLRGILPFEAPEGLGMEAWGALDGNWQSWSDETAELVSKLYVEEGLDVAGQRAVLASLKSRIGVMDRALADARYRSIHGKLLDLRGRLARRVDLAEAILDTFEIDPADVQERRIERARRDLGEAVIALRDDLRGIRGGSAWLPYVKADRLLEIAGSNEAARGGAAVLEEVAGKFARRDTLEGSQREFFERPAFDRLGEEVNGLLDAIRTPPTPSDVPKLREALAGLVEALEDYELARSAPAAKQARTRLRALAPVTVDGGERVTDAMRAHYINYNVLVVASENFLNRLIGRPQQESSPVQDQVMEASVYGSQTTTTTPGIDLKPRKPGARFDITLGGVTQSNTQAVTQQATIFTQGYHQFWGAKQVDFDGETFATSPARFSVNANNQTVGARTQYSGAFLIGKIADGIAVREAQRRQPQSNAIAASRLSEQARPRFDSEVDERFAKANQEIEALNERLKEAGVYPSTTLFQTTETHLQVSARVMNEDELAGDRVNHTLTRGGGVTLHVHESLLNNTFDRIGIAGRTLDEQQLRAEIEGFFSKIAGRDLSVGGNADEAPAERDPSQFVLDANDPIRVRFQGGTVTLVLRTGLKRPGEEDIPTQEISVPMTYSIEDDQLVVTRGDVGVAPVERPPSIAAQLARAGVMRERIQQAVPDRTRDRKFTIQREGESDIVLTIDQFEPRNGWLTISAR